MRIDDIGYLKSVFCNIATPFATNFIKSLVTLCIVYYTLLLGLFNIIKRAKNLFILKELLLYKYIIGQEQNDGVHEDDEEAEQENARTQQHLSQ
jgi:hypothetical protein